VRDEDQGLPVLGGELRLDGIFIPRQPFLGGIAIVLRLAVRHQRSPLRGDRTWGGRPRRSLVRQTAVFWENAWLRRLTRVMQGMTQRYPREGRLSSFGLGEGVAPTTDRRNNTAKTAKMTISHKRGWTASPGKLGRHTTAVNMSNKRLVECPKASASTSTTRRKATGDNQGDRPKPRRLGSGLDRLWE
jgi:hypothetical protein